MAVRAAAGVSNGDSLARQSFRLGAKSASENVIDFGGDAIGLFRGGNGSLVAGSRIAVGNVEYRLPLALIERGHGTWPLFLKSVHAAAFVDAGRVTGSTATSVAWRHAAGAELSLDGVAGFAMPFTASVGAAWGHDAGRSLGASAYVRIGHAF